MEEDKQERTYLFRQMGWGRVSSVDKVLVAPGDVNFHFEFPPSLSYSFFPLPPHPSNFSTNFLFSGLYSAAHSGAVLTTIGHCPRQMQPCHRCPAFLAALPAPHQGRTEGLSPGMLHDTPSRPILALLPGCVNAFLFMT